MKRDGFILLLQVVKGLLKFWPKTCSQKEVNLVSLLLCGIRLASNCDIGSGIF